MAGPASFFLLPNFFPLPRSSLLAAPGGECSEQTTQRRLAVGGWLLRSISCLWLTTASCAELQHLTPIKFFPPRGGRCHEGLTSFVGLETQAFQQLKKTGPQVSSPSEDLESRRNSETPLDRFGRGEESNSTSLSGLGPHFPFGLFTLWVGTHIPSSFGGIFSFQRLRGF